MMVYVWSGCSFLVGVIIGLVILWKMRRSDDHAMNDGIKKLMASLTFDGSLTELEVRKLIQKSLDEMKIKIVEEDNSPRKWVMPDEKTEEMFDLYTKWDVEDDRVARCKFWKMVNDQFPETKGVNGHFDDSLATKIVIRKGGGRMKVTIYTEDGKVCRELECDEIEPYGKAMMKFKGANICTNQPFVASGQYKDWDHMLPNHSETFDVVFTAGETIKKWEKAKCLIVYGASRLFSFWHKGEWHSVVGQVLIENMRNA